MSEYQYYEFLAVDRPLDKSDQRALRALSTRARITATRFVNSYEWGDFKGDPARLMDQWFDLHLYFANWGTRRLMLRVPGKFVDLPRLDCFLNETEVVTVRTSGKNVIFDIFLDGEDYDGWDDDDGEDGSELAALAPLRAELIAGDLRMCYLLWLKSLEFGAVADDAIEPEPWFGAMTASLQAFADFFHIDPDLLQAAVESGRGDESGPSAPAVQAAVAALPDDDKNAFLVRLFDAEPYAGTQLRRLLHDRLRPDEPTSRPPPRTARVLRARAEAIRVERERIGAEFAAAQRRRQAEEAEKQRRIRLDALAKRGETVWAEIEAEIGRRNASGYDKAAGLLGDLQAIAVERDEIEGFARRLATLRERHSQKQRFIDRLKNL